MKKVTLVLLTLMSSVLLMPEVSKAQDPELVKKAQAGDASAQSKLASYYFQYYFDHSKSPEFSKKDATDTVASALQWLQKSAEAGDIGAQVDLAGAYKSAFWIAPDYAKSLYWYTKAAEGGSHNAENNLSLMYINGEGTPKDLQKALHWTRKSAEGGDVDGQLDLARAYRDGALGLTKSYEKARFWYEKAAAQAASNGASEKSVGALAKQELAQLQAQPQTVTPQSAETAPQQLGRVAPVSASPQPTQPSARSVSVAGNNNRGTMPAEENLGSWSSYNATFVSPDLEIRKPYTQSVNIRNGRIISALHFDAVHPTNYIPEPAENTRNEVALRDLDPASVSLTRSSGNASCPIGYPPATCVYLVTKGKRNVVTFSHDGDVSAAGQRPALELLFPDAGTAQQAIVELARLILKYQSLGPVTTASNQPAQPYWFAYIFSDGDAPAPVAGWCSSNNNYDRVDARNCAETKCRQQAGNFFTCHGAEDVQVVQHIWVAGAQDAQGRHGSAAAATQDDASSKALSVCNPFGGCHISFVQELFPK